MACRETQFVRDYIEGFDDVVGTRDGPGAPSERVEEMDPLSSARLGIDF